MTQMPKKRIFIVHGRDELPALELARLIEHRYKIETILLEEKPNIGRTIFEKFEDHSVVNFAFVILTPDDVGGLKGEEPKQRARQNVIFELGHFIGKIGREKVCLLVKGNIEIPSDLAGLGYYKFKQSVRERFLDFESDLKKAGLIPAPEKEYIERKKTKTSPELRELYHDSELDQRTEEIPWSSFDDIEIQGILRQYFGSLGYKVDWAYTIARSTRKEIGCDLLGVKKGDSVGVVAKRILRLKDLEIVETLSRRDYDEKLLLYVEQPSAVLVKKLNNLSQRFVMMSLKEFEDRMGSTEVGLEILCYILYSNSEFVTLVCSFLSSLIRITEEPTEKDLVETNKPMPQLWQLKDYSVTMEKSIETLLTLLEEPGQYVEASGQNLLQIFRQGLGILAHCMFGFSQTWRKLLRDNRNLVRKTHLKYGDRSNWLGLWTYGSYMNRSSIYVPGVLKGQVKTLPFIKKESYDKEEAKFAALIRKQTGRSYVPTPLFANFVREDFLRPHFGFALSLEGLVDQFFEL